MKRDERLADLSRDHHHALVLARRCARAARELDEPQLERVWGEVRAAFAGQLEPHFAVEERTLFAALSNVGEPGLVERALLEHQRLRELKRGHGRDDLAAFGELLTAHVRFEERELFPYAEAHLGDEALAAVAAASGGRATRS